ncbi:MAG: ChaN family lipoprotein [Bdellovibrio sp.]
MQPWIRIRNQLYRRLEAHVRLLLGQESKGLTRYRKNYDHEFARKPKVSSREQLVEEISRSSVILIGDFHALQQSQKAQLRILKSIPNQRRIVLAAEFFEARHQKILDQFVSGQVSESDFLKAIQWQKAWGFPWEHYRPLIRWAMKRKVRVVGINKKTKNRSITTLAQRDQFAAQKIAEIRHKVPDHLVVCIYGDLHLAAPHLPRQIERLLSGQSERLLTIFQNSEKLYFQLLEKGLELEVDVVRLSKNQFCLLNVPPWVKWQNYLLFLENHLDQEIRDGSDYHDEVQNYLQILEHDLAVKVPLGSYSVASAQERHFWDQVSQKFSEKDRKFLQGWVEKGASFYLPELQSGFLARPSVNHAAQLASGILHAHMSDWKTTPVKMPDDFLKLIWIETVQYFGTKLINPKRKTDTLQDIKASLAVRLPDDLGKEALQLALGQKMNELLAISGQGLKRPLIQPRKMSSYHEAARLLGGMLGEKLFLGYHQKALSKETVVGLIRRPVEEDSFRLFYYEVLELIESLPEPFLSKNEKL